MQHEMISTGLDTRTAAAYIGIRPATMSLWRRHGHGPRHYHAGSRLIRYRRPELDRWIAENMRTERTGEP